MLVLVLVLVLGQTSDFPAAGVPFRLLGLFSFKYDVRMPWYARFILGKNIIWHDVLHADPATKVYLGGAAGARYTSGSCTGFLPLF